MKSDDQSNNSETEHSTQGSDDIASNNTPTKLAFHFFSFSSVVIFARRVL